MYLCFIFYIILCIPHLYGNSISTPIIDTHINQTNVTQETKIEVPKNITKVSLITEAGPVEAEQPVGTLPKEEHSSLINLDKEIGKSKIKSIVPRKGVKYNPSEDNVTDINITRERIDTTIKDHNMLGTKVSSTADEPPVPPQSNSSTTSHLINSPVNNITENVTNKILINKLVDLPKKPLVLSAEAISETDKKVAMEKAKLGTSSKPLLTNQLPSPKVKYEQLSSTSHPGMVMPVVITMLVVPMFAVLGYMALRRGQEAWKNRHYKRMDFLLDGMYND